MIISASRREDIPARRMDWFLERLREGFVEVRNPFDARRIRRVGLLPGELDCLVFWTRDPRPLTRAAAELEERGLPFLAQLTLTGYPAALEPGVPRREEAIDAFLAFARRVGPGRATWRYDPLVLDPASLDAAWHRDNFLHIARALSGATDRLVLSALDEYRGTGRRLAAAGLEGPLYPRAAAAEREEPELFPAERGAAERAAAEDDPATAALAGLLADLAAIGRDFGFAARTCAEPALAAEAGIPEGACIDPAWIARATGKAPPPGRDRGQRPGCRCAPSVDIGEYGRCEAGCAYCYARR